MFQRFIVESFHGLLLFRITTLLQHLNKVGDPVRAICGLVHPQNKVNMRGGHQKQGPNEYYP